MLEGSSLVGRSISRYRILDVVGKGGMGVVYRAHDEQLQRDVALKVLSPGLVTNENARKHFLKEALALAKMNHPNIETVHEFASQDGVDYLVTEYIPGKSLAEILKAGALPEKEVSLLGEQIAAGLEEAHERGIVHCDLKPDNVLVTAKRQAKVLDFGVARLLRPTVDTTTLLTGETGITLTGTLPYMAPEQLSAHEPDTRTDVHALGLVLYEMATGERAFPENTVPALLDAILHKMPVPPRERNALISAELERIILKALDKEPDRRYQSARELKVDLERVITPTTAPVAPRISDTAWQRIRRVSRRHPKQVAVSASIIGAALVAIFWFLGSRPVFSFSPRDWILLTDLDNQTGEAVFDRSLLTALTVGLEQSAHANVFPRARIPDSLKRMNKPATTAIDENVGREICVRENLRGLLAWRIARVGQEYLLSAEVVDPHTGVSVRSYLEKAKGQEEVLTALDKIAKRLRSDLGESLSAIGKADRPLPQITTSSLPALKNYVDGNEAWAKGRYPEAVQLFKNALQLDPDFAMAHAALGNADYSFIFNDPADGKMEYEKALQLTTRTTDRERLSIQVGYASYLKHTGEAAKLYHLYLDTYPDDWRMRSNFAALLKDIGQFQESIDQYLEAIRLSPEDAGPYINIATAYSQMGNVEQSLRYYDQGFKLQPEWKTSGNLNGEYGFTLVRSGNESEAIKVFEEALAKPNMKGPAQRSLGWLALYHGQYKKAKESFEESRMAYRAQKGAPLSEARTDVILAIVADGQGDRVRSLRELGEAQAFLPNIGAKVWVATMIGDLYARFGAPQKAEQMLQFVKPFVDLQNPDESSQLHRLQGEIALAEGKKTEAVESFNLAQNEKAGPQTAEELARAYAAAGDVDQSINWYEKFVQAPNMMLGWEIQQDWLAGHYFLAKAYAARSEKEKAAALLEKLLNLWKDGDPDIPLLKAAKAQYATVH